MYVKQEFRGWGGDGLRPGTGCLALDLDVLCRSHELRALKVTDCNQIRKYCYRYEIFRPVFSGRFPRFFQAGSRPVSASLFEGFRSPVRQPSGSLSSISFRPSFRHSSRPCFRPSFRDVFSRFPIHSLSLSPPPGQRKGGSQRISPAS